jgi:acetate kinase
VGAADDDVNILVVNCGSSSVKYSLFAAADGLGTTERVRGPGYRVLEHDPGPQTPDPRPSAASSEIRVPEAADRLAWGIVERVGQPEGLLRHTAGGREVRRPAAAPDHRTALGLMVEALTRGEGAVLGSLADIAAVGHRVVHAAERFTGSVRLDPEVLAALEACVPLAPLHNPPNLVGVRAALDLLPGAVHVGVFDTAFHQTLAPEAYLYAVPYDLYARHGVRRYGFHGTSHRYVALRAAAMLGRPPAEVNLITAHLGNGCSITAIEAGRSVDTSMGLTPLEGLVMGTRSGDLDPAIVFHLARTLGLPMERLEDLLNRESGLLGLSGVSSDMREVQAAADRGHGRARLALAIFSRRLRKYIGAYTAVLGRVDALVFTGGIGENSAPVREQTCRGLEPVGYALDAARNAAPGRGERDVAAPDSRSRILVVPTDEEAMIARDTARIARGESTAVGE